MKQIFFYLYAESLRTKYPAVWPNELQDILYGGSLRTNEYFINDYYTFSRVPILES